MRDDSLVALLPFLVADGCELVVTLGAYFDESDRQEGTAPICIAGYVFSPGGYRRFARHWRKFLKSAKAGGLTHLHMTDLYAGGGEYRDLGDQREDIFARAVELINDNIMAGIAVLFEQEEFERTAPPWFAQLQGSIYSTACQMCMRATAFWLQKHGRSQLVAYTFENGHKFQHEANAIMSRMGSVVTDTHRYHSHTFADKKTTAGLQAADVLAWVLARAEIGFPRNRTIQLFRPHLLSLAKDNDKYQVLRFTDEMLRRFFQEQLDRPTELYFKRPPEMRGRLR